MHLFSCFHRPTGSLPDFSSRDLRSSASRLASPLRVRDLSDFVSNPDLIRRGAVVILCAPVPGKLPGLKARTQLKRDLSPPLRAR